VTHPEPTARTLVPGTDGDQVRWSDGAVTVADRFTYRFAGTPRPHCHPVRTPSGRVLTVDAPEDHFWHHALWFAIKFVNGDNYWEELPPFGVLAHRDDPPVLVEEATDGITVEGALDWVHPDGAMVVLGERRRLTHRHLDDDSYAIDIAVDLDARVDVTLDRTPFNGTWGGYGGLTFRGRPELVDTRLLLLGHDPTDRVLGERAPALDLSGHLEGTEVGVALLDAPTNPRHPVPWYGSTRAGTYGDDWANFVNAAFLWHEPMAVAAGEQLSLSWRVIVHDGAWSPAHLQAAWDAWQA
jgi:hypothetical protein